MIQPSSHQEVLDTKYRASSAESDRSSRAAIGDTATQRSETAQRTRLVVLENLDAVLREAFAQ